MKIKTLGNFNVNTTNIMSNQDINKIKSREWQRLKNETVPPELRELYPYNDDTEYIKERVIEMTKDIEGQCKEQGKNLVSPVPGDQWFRIIINDSEQIWVLLFPHPSILLYSIKAYTICMGSWVENPMIAERRVYDLSCVIEAIKEITRLLENVQ